jgi:hypothetical protein
MESRIVDKNDLTRYRQPEGIAMEKHNVLKKKVDKFELAMIIQYQGFVTAGACQFFKSLFQIMKAQNLEPIFFALLCQN